MYAVGSNSAKSSAPNSRRCLAVASMHPASSSEHRFCWTLKLLAGAIVKLTDHNSLSHETVRRRLAENDLKPWRKDMWCIPQVDGEYVARMEDVLDCQGLRTLDLLHSLVFTVWPKASRTSMPSPKRAASNTPNGWLCSWNTRKRCANKSGSKAELEPPSYVIPPASRMSITALSAASTARSFKNSPLATGSGHDIISSLPGHAASARAGSLAPSATSLAETTSQLRTIARRVSSPPSRRWPLHQDAARYRSSRSAHSL